MNHQNDILQNIAAGLTVSFVALSFGAACGILSGRGAFTAFFYLLNKVFMRRNPMRDLQPLTETEGIRDEP